MFLTRKKAVKARRNYITKLEDRIAEENEQRAFYFELINKFREEVQDPYLKGQVDSKVIEGEVNSLSDEELLNRASVHLKEIFEGQRHIYFQISLNNHVSNSGIDSLCLLCFAVCSDALHNMPNHMLRKDMSGLRFDLIRFYEIRNLVLEYIEKHLKEHLNYSVHDELIKNFKSSQFKA
ncbi:hypothetical protein [Priestia megaterium]|uniref:hypothetical protein n=1 Tax=Priestia megaterium TaxID=1404 RepID=UPI0018695932|nr:hypothetical protein [Priestia megaterium]MBE2977787.1 hypothetical protein [Priestia megaterium]